MNWYIVQAYSGFEKKVVEAIKDELKKNKLSENLQEILVPTHHVTEVKKGDTADSIFTRVDNYLYESKDKGRNTITSDISSSS